MKEVFYTVTGVFGSAFTYFMGGSDALVVVLSVFLAVDWLMGIVVAMVFKNSTKTKSGGLNSTVGFKGLCRKFFILMLVGVAHQLDTIMGVQVLRGGVIVAFISNETISIIENAGLMGITIPKVLKEAIDILNEREV